MKTKPKLRARRMWANYYGDFVACHDTRSAARAEAYTVNVAGIAIPVAVIPLDDVPALVTAACEAYLHASFGRDMESGMRAALSAIGLLPRKGGRK